MQKLNRLAGLGILYLLPLLAFAATTPVEIVQSIPEGTNLALPELRQAKDVWPLMIDAAKSTLDIAQMYVSSAKGRALEPVIEALEAAGNRGVKIRFLLWVGMQENDPASLARLRAIPNLTLAIYDISKVTGGFHHAKYWVVDGKEIFVGSQNFDWLSLEEIHETGVRIESKPLADRLETVFAHDWGFATTGAWGDESVPASSNAPSDVELLSSPERLNPKGVSVAITRLLELLGNAKESIRIALLDYSTTAYSGDGPWTEIDDALRAAAKRGVKVELLLSHWNTAKNEIGAIRALAVVPGIEVKISFVPDLPTGHVPYSRVIHTKHMIVDGKTYWVGTSNWSRGYFYDARDIEIVMNRPDLARTGARIFEAVWTAPFTEDLDPNRDYPAPIK
jgi:phosphatidylserine/phosphatidylglycerophosphate/cardiolipin synthase-like enzyme